jgi:hypothetical protein
VRCPHERCATLKRLARAIGIALQLVASGSSCSDHAAASVTMKPPTPTASVVRSDTADMVPQPPFDTTPITPVESVGASRSE